MTDIGLNFLLYVLDGLNIHAVAGPFRLLLSLLTALHLHLHLHLHLLLLLCIGVGLGLLVELLLCGQLLQHLLLLRE